MVTTGLAVLSVATAAPAFMPHGVPVHNPPPRGVLTQPIAPSFAPLEGNALVPGDVLNNVVVPEGAKATRYSNLNQNQGSYQRAVTYASPYSPKILTRFFPPQLARRGWIILSEVPSPTGMEILAKHPGSDGYYWEAGVVVDRAPLRAGQFSVELRQLQDPT